MLVNVRSRDGEYLEPSSLEEAIRMFIDDSGYRLSFVINDTQELHIYRDEYNDDHPSAGPIPSTGIRSQIADAKVIITHIKRSKPLPNLSLVK
jgi:hypothetical protein